MKEEIKNIFKIKAKKKNKNLSDQDREKKKRKTDRTINSHPMSQLHPSTIYTRSTSQVTQSLSPSSKSQANPENCSGIDLYSHFSYLVKRAQPKTPAPIRIPIRSGSCRDPVVNLAYFRFRRALLLIYWGLCVLPSLLM